MKPEIKILSIGETTALVVKNLKESRYEVMLKLWSYKVRCGRCRKEIKTSFYTIETSPKLRIEGESSICEECFLERKILSLEEIKVLKTLISI